MKITKLSIAVDEIPEAGWVVRGELPVEWMTESLLPPYTATSPVQVDLEARRVAENVLVSGRATVELAFECSRTLAPGLTTLDVDVHELFTPGERHALNLEAGVDADDLEATDEPWILEGGRLDLEPLLRETLVLAQDPYPVVGDKGEADEDRPLWQSGRGEVDPRWARLKDIKLD